MKIIIHSVIISCLFILFANQNTAQVRDRDREILVYIQPGFFELPEDRTGQVTFKEINTISERISQIVQDNNVLTFTKAFPEFMPSDTIVVNDDGCRIKLPNMSRIFILTLDDSSRKDVLIEDLLKTEGVLFAEKHVNWKTFDTRYPEQWALNNTGQFGGTTDADIDAPEAWQITQGSSNIKVGIIDTGVETNHPDLSGKTTGDLPENDPYNGYGHGTHVAGIVGAKVEGGDVLGVCPNTSLISKKVFSGGYGGQPIFEFDEVVYNKITSAVNEGCSILNHSYGGTEWSYLLKAAYVYGYKMNRLSVAAMGNEYGTQINFPAALKYGMIAVGSTDINDSRPSYSNYGNHIDVSAPGGCCASGSNTSILSTWRDNGYLKTYGTSMAAPVVAGIAALLKAYNQNLYNDDIEQIIRISADDKHTPGWDQYYGTGRVNAYNALKLLQAPYQLSQLSASGGQDYSVSDYYQMGILGASGLTDGTYIVKRHEVRKNVTFPGFFDHYAWGRGYGTTGWSDENTNFTHGFCEVIPGTLTSTSVTLRTYVYEVWDLTSYRGYFPTTPQNVTFKYTVLGEPLVFPIISHFTQNPDPICIGGSGYVYVNLSQGNGDLDYDWYSYDEPSYIITEPQGNRCRVSYLNTDVVEYGDGPLWDFGCVVSNSAGSDQMNYTVNLDDDCGGCPTLAIEVNGEMIDDNPLLITSLSNPGEDVTDYYLLQNPVTPAGNKINLRIHEPQTEHTWLDQVELIEAKVNHNEFVAVTDDGEIVNYRKPSIPFTITLNDTMDVSDILNDLDSLTLNVYEGDILRVELNRQSMDGDGNDNIILGGEEELPPKDIMGTIRFANKSIDGKGTTTNDESKFQDFGEFYFRPNMSVICKRLGNFREGYLEILFAKGAELDYLMIARNLRTASTRTPELLSAFHNLNGDVLQKLLNKDEDYAEIYPGEDIVFKFRNRPGSQLKTKYILKSVGRYETDTTFAFNKVTSTSENNIIPKENKLFENYPNPFNPITKIKFSIKEDGFVNLKVYDVLGNQVADLVNEEKSAGTYTVDFNAIDLSSGIYLYTISNNNFRQTKKMILLK